jgi:hypothetical protein
MPLIEWSSNGSSIEVETTGYLQLDDPRLVKLLASIHALNEGISLASLTVEVLDGVADYQWTTQNGRVWSQTMTINPGQETVQTFDVSDGFTLSEFASHRPVRDAVDVLIRSHSLVRVEVTFS